MQGSKSLHSSTTQRKKPFHKRGKAEKMGKGIKKPRNGRQQRGEKTGEEAPANLN